jgi:ADP-ribosylglycohydrolase
MRRPYDSDVILAKDILDAVYGCLIGGAVGDALGAPLEGLYYTDIREKYGKLKDFIPSYQGNTGKPRGQPGIQGVVTDDTTLRHYMCYAIVKKGGRITPDDFAKVLLEKKMNPNRLWSNEKITLMKLQVGMNPWETGRGNPPAGCAVMAIAPIGIINAGDPSQAYQDASNIASINQEGVNRDAAATVAAGVAAAFLPGATVESILETMMEHSADIVRRAIVLTMDLAHRSSSVDEFAEKFYSEMLDWTWPALNWNKDRFFSASSLEIVPASMAILYLCNGDTNQSIIEGANFGRDCDTIGSLCGCLAGAMNGASSIREDWICDCEKANEDLFEELEGDRGANFLSMAKRLIEALENEERKTLERGKMLERILGNYLKH